MAIHAVNGHIAGMDYIRFGTGSQVLVMLPGLGDGLQTVKGTALPMAWMYRIFSRQFTVYMFSRKTDLDDGITTRDMARDLSEGMDALGIGRAHVLGVSMGGMIAQWLAIDFPEKVGRLVLTVTAPKANPVLVSSVEQWMDLARQGDHTAFMDSNLRILYSDSYYRKNRWTLPLLGWLTRPKSYRRFLIQAEACLRHDATDRLAQITAPTLIVGGEQDRALGPEASRDLAMAIPGAELKMYPQYGHSLYEEAADFNALVLDFLTE